MKELHQDLWNVFTKVYGAQCNKERELIEKRIAALVAATLYAGIVGDNPLCKLNRAFDEVTK